MDKKPYDRAFTFKDDPGVRETFADGIHLVTVDGSTLRIVFTVGRADPPKTGNKQPTGNRVAVARLVMPLPGLAELYNQLDGMVRGLESQGLLTRGGGGVKPTVQ
jgi:hypothetical protein